MAQGHSYFWRRPGRRDEERRKFATLMQKVEVLRIRIGMSRIDLARELQTTPTALRNWMTGRTLGRKETVAKIQDFLKRQA